MVQFKLEARLTSTGRLTCRHPRHQRTMYTRVLLVAYLMETEDRSNAKPQSTVKSCDRTRHAHINGPRYCADQLCKAGPLLFKAALMIVLRQAGRPSRWVGGA